MNRPYRSDKEVSFAASTRKLEASRSYTAWIRKRWFGFALVAASVVISVVGLMLALMSCTPQQAKDATRTMLRVADVACILAKAEFDTPAALEACAIEKVFAPDVDRIRSAHNAAARREYAGACTMPDGGQ